MNNRPDVEWHYGDVSADLKHSLCRTRYQELHELEPSDRFTHDPASGGLSDYDVLALSLLGFAVGVPLMAFVIAVAFAWLF